MLTLWRSKLLHAFHLLHGCFCRGCSIVCRCFKALWSIVCVQCWQPGC